MTRTVLVVAKAPVAGLVKTRLVGAVTDDEAASLAAAALLDTLYCALAVPRSRVVVALTGELGAAARAGELAVVLARCTVIQQRGATFADRLVAAHAEAGTGGVPVVQVGMDTPQLTTALLELAFDRLVGVDAVLGPAEDGGWWALGLNDPVHAEGLATVTMSTAQTGDHTRASLVARGLRVAGLPVLRDVDTFPDACWVSAIAPRTRFAAAMTQLRERSTRGVA